ncbi:MAG: phospholipase D-like domain-containing protein [Thermoanaerobaculia bacterium]
MRRRRPVFSIAPLVAAATLLLPACSFQPRGQAVYFFEGKADPSQAEFTRELSSATGEPAIGGNRCELLEDGDRMFPAMLEEIRRARFSVNLETYIFGSDETGTRFARAIEERARAGVRCRVLVDAWGSHTLSKGLEAEMKKAGVEFERFRPLLLFHRLKNRTHRKILVVDGRVGFVGGQGFDDRWEGDADSPRHWHDAAVRIEGPGVARLQGIFAENWIGQKRPVPSGPGDYPDLAPAGDETVIFQRSSFGERNSRSALGFDLLVHAATREVRIENAYFLPDSTATGLLTDAVKRGVRVEIIVPGPRNNLGYVRDASRALYGPLLEGGVRIFEYRPTMMHAKTMEIDRIWASVGSANIDDRSFFLNDEANVLVRSPEFCADVSSMFERDLARSDEVTLKKWRSRSFGKKLIERFLGLFQSEL